ncbi:MAG: membrane protein insertase YidC [Deltaproteobacteria bacterium]|nr:membrane protein insertase YidC [Deltaproteobacteria bacterium]
MEQGRLLIAIALSVVVFFVWNFFFVEKPVPEKKQSDEIVESKAEEPTAKAATPAAEPPKTPNTFVASESPSSKPAMDARTITVTTPLYRVRISEAGAVFKSFELEKYKETAEKNSVLKNLIDPQSDTKDLKMSFAGNGISGFETAVFNLDEKIDAIEVTNESRSLTFSWQSENGVVIEKRFSFHPESYLIDLSLVIKNGSGSAFSDSAVVELQHKFANKRTGYAFEGPSLLLDGKLEEIKPKKIEDKNRFDGTVGWLAIEDRYFMRSLIPMGSQEGTVQLSQEGDGIVVSRFQVPERMFQAGETAHYDYKVFFGPQNMKLLNSLGFDLGKAVQFGIFTFIAKPLLWFMNFIYSVIPNYGVAIIILTIVTKIILWPLGNKSYKSMNEMKKIQPLMADLREKYKNDKKQMNQELMALYRTYKINPMGGCLPMVLQIPVFFALYRMLYQAIELRHSPFLLWINDLSAPDRLFRFDFTVPFMQPPYGIPVLTLVMGATMFLQQKMTPSPGDPAQAKMMMFMPIVFTFIFINFSSGLVLYWLVNNVLSIAQQYYIQKKYA